MIEDVIRTGLDAVPEETQLSRLGPVVRARSRRRRGTFLVATGAAVAGAAVVGVSLANGDPKTAPAVLGDAQAPTSGALAACAAGPFDLALNGQPVTASAGFREATGVTLPGSAGAPPAEDAAPGKPTAGAWTLSRSQTNTLQVSAAGTPTAVRLVQLTLLANADGPNPGGIADSSTGDGDTSHGSAQATIDLRLRDTGQLAAPGTYGLDVMVSVLNCAAGAVHVVQPVTITS
jgi:hypothetical protein